MNCQAARTNGALFTDGNPRACQYGGTTKPICRIEVTDCAAAAIVSNKQYCEIPNIKNGLDNCRWGGKCENVTKTSPADKLLDAIKVEFDNFIADFKLFYDAKLIKINHEPDFEKIYKNLEKQQVIIDKYGSSNGVWEKTIEDSLKYRREYVAHKLLLYSAEMIDNIVMKDVKALLSLDSYANIMNQLDIIYSQNILYKKIANKTGSWFALKAGLHDEMDAPETKLKTEIVSVKKGLKKLQEGMKAEMVKLRNMAASAGGKIQKWYDQRGFSGRDTKIEDMVNNYLGIMVK